MRLFAPLVALCDTSAPTSYSSTTTVTTTTSPGCAPAMPAYGAYTTCAADGSSCATYPYPGGYYGYGYPYGAVSPYTGTWAGQFSFVCLCVSKSGAEMLSAKGPCHREGEPKLQVPELASD
eukprot:1820803-Rhodomonas_salina.1